MPLSLGVVLLFQLFSIAAPAFQPSVFTKGACGIARRLFRNAARERRRVAKVKPVSPTGLA